MLLYLIRGQQKEMKELTKKEIADALRSLAAEKSLSAISIKDITERAGVNRQTFYYHFRDIIGLLEWICLEDEKRLLEGRNTFDNWQKSFLSIFHEIRKDRVFIMNVYRSAPPELLMTHLYSIVYQIIYTVVDEKARNYDVSEDDKKFITDFFKYSFVAIVLEWIKGGMEDCPERIVGHLSILLEGTVDRSLENFSRSNRCGVHPD